MKTTILSLVICLFSFFQHGDVAIGKIDFKDVTAQAGLVEPLKGMMGHGAAWGDINSDGYPDLFVGTFSGRPDAHYAERGHPAWPASNKLLLNNGDGTFTEVMNSPVNVKGRNSGSAFADFDNDGDLDLVISHNSYDGEKEITHTGNFLFENDGKGGLTDVTEKSGLDFGTPFTGRNTFVLDYDGDGLLDLLMQEDWLRADVSGGNSRLMKNTGGLTFKDVTVEAGLPSGYRTGLWGVGGWVGDINGDTWPDFFFAHSNRLFINNQDGTFHEMELDLFPEFYSMPAETGGGFWTCGADLGDIDNDGDMDFIVGDHFRYETDSVDRKIYIILNEGNDKNDDPVLRDVTEMTGEIPPGFRAPVVLLRDLDNDGRVDLLVGNCYEFAYRNSGISEGVPHFEAPVSSGIKGGIGYWAAGVPADYDRDGRLDFFAAEWEPSVASPLLRNTTEEAENYLEIELDLEDTPNRNGIGSRIEVFERGKLGESNGLLASRMISVSNGYSSGSEAIVHFGLPDNKKVDIRVSMPDDGQVFEIKSVKRNQRLVVKNP